MSDIEILLDMTYKKFVSFLKQKYGKVKYDFPNNNGKKDGLNRHYIDEDKVDALNKKENWNNYPEYQKANRLVYCTPQEHHILHIKIFEESKINFENCVNKLLLKIQKKINTLNENTNINWKIEKLLELKYLLDNLNKDKIIYTEKNKYMVDNVYTVKSEKVVIGYICSQAFTKKYYTDNELNKIKNILLKFNIKLKN